MLSIAFFERTCPMGFKYENLEVFNYQIVNFDILIIYFGKWQAWINNISSIAPHLIFYLLNDKLVYIFGENCIHEFAYSMYLCIQY